MTIKFCSTQIENTEYINLDNVTNFYFDDKDDLIFQFTDNDEIVISFKDREYRDKAISHMDKLISGGGLSYWWEVQTGL